MTSIVLLTAVLSLGSRPAAALRNRLDLPAAGLFGVAAGSGIALASLLVLVLGHVSLLTPATPLALLAAGLATLPRSTARSDLRAVKAATRSFLRSSYGRLSAPFLALGLLTCLAPPWRSDEVEYHWAAAAEWAQAGRWVDSSYRHVDGFPLFEVLFTAAATRDAWLAAHLLHALCLLGLASVVACLAQRSGGLSQPAVFAAALAMPVAFDQAFVGYNDVAVALFAALAVLVCHRGEDEGGLPSLGRALVSGTFLAVGVSVKPHAVVAAGLVGLMVLLQAPRPWAWTFARPLLRTWALLALPPVVALVAWTLRRYLIAGEVLDPVLANLPAEALERQADVVDKVLLPVMPYLLGVLGQWQPWGGRTGAVLLLFLPLATLWAVRTGPSRARAQFWCLFLPAWTLWVVSGLFVVPRTRLSIVTWCLLIVAVRVAVEQWRGTVVSPKNVTRLWLFALALGFADSAFEAARAVRDQVLPSLAETARLEVDALDLVAVALVIGACAGWRRARTAEPAAV